MGESSKVVSMKLKLLVDTKGQKVLFAEAGKDFVDFLFLIFSLPIGTVVNLLAKEKSMVGSLGDLHKSLESLSGDYLLDNPLKDWVMNPRPIVRVPLLSINHGRRCPSCGSSMSKAGGLVKGGVNYMVTDNLEVKPLSTLSSITTINKFNVKDVNFLVEKEVQVGLNEGLAILKASMETQDVLSTVFLGRSRVLNYIRNILNVPV